MRRARGLPRTQASVHARAKPTRLIDRQRWCTSHREVTTAEGKHLGGLWWCSPRLMRAPAKFPSGLATPPATDCLQSSLPIGLFTPNACVGLGTERLFFPHSRRPETHATQPLVQKAKPITQRMQGHCIAEGYFNVRKGVGQQLQPFTSDLRDAGSDKRTGKAKRQTKLPRPVERIELQYVGPRLGQRLGTCRGGLNQRPHLLEPRLEGRAEPARTSLHTVQRNRTNRPGYETLMRLSTPPASSESRPESRYNRASLCASLENGHEAGHEFLVPIIQMNFSESSQGQAILPHCWT